MKMEQTSWGELWAMACRLDDEELQDTAGALIAEVEGDPENGPRCLAEREQVFLTAVLEELMERGLEPAYEEGLR